MSGICCSTVLAQPKKEVPTLREFAPRFLDGHAQGEPSEAKRHRREGDDPSSASGSRCSARRALDAITNEDVQRLKRHLRDEAPKTVNNVLTVLSTLLKTAVEWDVIDRMPCAIRLLPVPKSSASFHDFDDYERLVAAAQGTIRSAYLIVLLGGEAGLRCGEMMALEWRTSISTKRQLCIQRSDVEGSRHELRRVGGFDMCR